MGRGFLLLVRVLTMLLALANAIINSYIIRTSKYGFKITWSAWLPLFLGAITDITFTWVIKAHRSQVNIIKSNTARHTCSFLLCAAWLVSPSYEVNYILDYLRRNYYSTSYFFEEWNCKVGRCQLNFARDLLGFFMAFFVFLEAILAHRYERSSKALAAAAAKPVTEVSEVVVAPTAGQQQPAPQPAQYAPMQQQPYVPQQQPYAQQPYAYHPAQQPAQPAAYYPQPAMTAPYQTPAMPYQAPTTPYQVPQQPPTYQPYPPKY
ncbi:MAG: hypothetical protein J3Q66DRAFT_403409 [Benniella sp.]|nr:MAG: hypothetical protein J3Q66DRAFT_403409 [Benniella sp.]